MKSFVYTVVAATIAASSAVANSTDASTSGTVPAIDQSNYCEFSDVSDGTMSYIAGYHNTGNGNKGAGYWRTHLTGAAEITVKTRGASVISIMGGDRVINRNDPSAIYPVKVDYTAQEVYNGGYVDQENWSLVNANSNHSYASSVRIENLPGETNLSMGSEVTGGGRDWWGGSFRRVFTTKEDPNHADDDTGVEWGHNSGIIRNPTAMEPADALVNGPAQAHDQLNWHMRYSNWTRGGQEMPNLEYVFELKIIGMAWMLGDDGIINYEDDGMGRTMPAPGSGIRKLSHYGMTDGDYYIEHTVQCLQ